MLKTPFMLKAVKKIINNKRKTLQHLGRRQLEEYMFDAFMPVFCVLAVKIL
jgi:hypothetical protein